ncbi:MAG: hypothetical protein AB7O84_21945 [Planctomycetota bacterium]
MHRPDRRARLPFLVAALLCPLAAAQYSPNPNANLAVADAGGEQPVPKIAATSDGGCYIGWFDNRNGGYEVWLQRLDAQGFEQWPHNGILVSGNPQGSSLVDWDLIADSEDHCVLTFTDTRAGGDLDVYAYRVDPTGAQLWGANGVALSQNTDFEPNPRVCEASDGDFVFVWANTGTQTLRLQRLDRLGVARYPQDGIGIPGDAGANPGFVRVVAADAGAVILSWVRTTAFTGNKHIHAQKFDTLGNPLWNGGTRLPVFDGGSVPIAHEPRLLPDGVGGAVIAWHFAGGSVFSARVQHVDAIGNEVWPHDGVDVSTNANSKFDPSVTWNVAAQAAVVVWNERNTAQTTWGISAQRIDALGNRAWGPAGTTLRPIDAVTKFAPVSVPFQGGALMFVLEQSLGGQNKAVRGVRVDQNGVVVWSPPVDACLVASDKLRLQAAGTPSGPALLCWNDLRNGAADVFAQNVGPTGSLAYLYADAFAYGCGINPAGSLVVDGRPAIGTTLPVHVDNPFGTQAAGSLPILAIASAPQPGFPCGVNAPGFGMSGPGAFGEILVDLGAIAVTFPMPFWAGPGLPSTLPLAIPQDLSFVGVSLYAQAVMLDGTPGAAVPLGVTTGSRWSFGF